MRYPTRQPNGTAIAKATTTSVAVTQRSLRTLARCNRSPSVASVSDADGSSRGLTKPVRDSTSHSAKSATMIANREAMSAKRPDMSGPGRHRLELGRIQVFGRHDVLQPAELGEIHRELHRVLDIGLGHVAVGFELHDGVVIFEAGDLGRDFVEISD